MANPATVDVSTLNGSNGFFVVNNDGKTMLAGGAGADTVVVRAEWPRATWAPSPSKVDIINDFVAAQGDRLDLSAIDADVNTAGDHAGEMILTLSGSNALLALDVDATGGPTIG